MDQDNVETEMTDIEVQMRKELAAASKLKESLVALEDDDLMRDMLEGETNLREMIEALLSKIEEDGILLAGIKAREEELQARSQRLKNRTERCRALIEQGMLMGEIKALELPGATLSLRKTPPKLIVNDEASIPPKFWKTGDPKLDKSAVKAALTADEQVPGATLSNGGITLQVRTK